MRRTHQVLRCWSSSCRRLWTSSNRWERPFCRAPFLRHSKPGFIHNSGSSSSYVQPQFIAGDIGIGDTYDFPVAFTCCNLNRHWTELFIYIWKKVKQFVIFDAHKKKRERETYLLRIQSSSNLYAKNSSSKFFRNWGLTRNDPTTSNSRTNPTGVHTKDTAIQRIRINFRKNIIYNIWRTLQIDLSVPHG